MCVCMYTINKILLFTFYGPFLAYVFVKSSINGYPHSIHHIKIKIIEKKAIAMMRRKSPPSENILCLIENHCQKDISKGRREKALILFHE